MSDFDEPYEEEVQLGQLFNSIGAAVVRLNRSADAAKEQQELKDITTKLQDARLLIRDFEKSARINEMKPSLIISRKRELNEQLNGFEQQRKQHAANMDNRKALLLKGAKGVPAPELKHSKYDNMTTQQMMDKGRKDIIDTEKGLQRSNKIVEDTIQVATATAETLNGQTEQLERTLDSLDRIEFSLKTARRVIRDITRGLATDKCIMFLTVMAILALIIMLVLKVFHIGQPQAKKALKSVVEQMVVGCRTAQG